jgi:hypothetical protein
MTRGLPLYLNVVAIICAGFAVSLFFEGPAGIAFGIIGLAFAGFLVVIARRIARGRRRLDPDLVHYMVARGHAPRSPAWS